MFKLSERSKATSITGNKSHKFFLRSLLRRIPRHNLQILLCYFPRNFPRLILLGIKFLGHPCCFLSNRIFSLRSLEKIFASFTVWN